MIAPKIPLVRDGQILSTNLVNSMIGRIEYAADLLRQYKLIAGNGMYVEPHYDGTRASYNQPVAGGATRRIPLIPFPYPDDLTPPINPTILVCDDSIGWSKSDSVGFDVCPTVGPPCAQGVASCAGQSVSGYIVSSAIWPNSCLSTRSPACSFFASFDNFGSIGTAQSSTDPCQVATLSGVISAQKGSYDATHFFLYVEYIATNSEAGGPYGFTGAGSFLLNESV